MKAILLILVASSAFADAQFNIFENFKGQDSFQNYQAGQAQGQVQSVDGQFLKENNQVITLEQNGLYSGDNNAYLNQFQNQQLGQAQYVDGQLSRENNQVITSEQTGFYSADNNAYLNQQFQEYSQPIPVQSQINNRGYYDRFNLQNLQSFSAPFPFQRFDQSQNNLNYPNSFAQPLPNSLFVDNPVSFNSSSGFPSIEVPNVSNNSVDILGHVGVVNVSQYLEGPSNLLVETLSNTEAMAKEFKLDAEWEEFKIKYQKVYLTIAQEAHRRQIYYDNKAKIEEFNTNGSATFNLGMNHFGDLTSLEFNEQNGFRASSKKNNGSSFDTNEVIAKPKLVDWRNFTGAVTDVKDQGDCYSCWAFTAAAVLETHWWRKTGKTVDISEQNLLDCRTEEEKDSCSPGHYTTAWEYIRDNKGVDGEQSYPYQSQNNDNFTCRFNREEVVATVTGFTELPEGDEEQMELVLTTLGPLAAAIDANIFAQQFYSGGVFSEAKGDTSGNFLNPKCTENVNHAVTIVGFGEEEDGQKFWWIKNSYGSSWGINGYMKLARGENACGIALYPAYPIV